MEFSIQEITNTAPGGVGGAYRLKPEGTTFPTPVALTFKVEPAATGLDGLTIAYQDDQGYWVRLQKVSRDAALGTLAASTTHFSGWSIVPGSGRDLSGSFTFDTTIGIPFSANGQSTLGFAGSDTAASYYLNSGTITVPASIPYGTSTCMPANPAFTLRANVAELVNSPAAFKWGFSAYWNIDCTGPAGQTSDVLSAAFDTAGIALVDCTRGYLSPPLIGADRVSGTYAIDCGPAGRETASWDFQTTNCSAPCASSNPCHAAAWSCATGTAVCTDTGNVADGTSCPGGVCGGGVCNACTVDAPCTTQPDPLCHLGTTTCSTGFPVCVNGVPLPDGTPCGTGTTCNAGTCVPSRTVAGTRLVSYWPDTGAPLAGVPAPDVAGPPLATVAALVPAAGGWITYPGTFAVSGSFSIPNVPTGTYLLSFVDGGGARTLVETSSSTVDLGYDLLGRSDVAVPLASTSVTLAVSGLAPWNPGGDEIQITSSNADVWDVPARGTQIAAGATGSPTPVQVVEDWFASAWSGGPLNLLAAADVLQVHDLATQTIASTVYTYQYAANWTSVTGIVLTSGTPASITASLAAAPQTGFVTGSSTHAVDWRLTQFEAQLPGLIGTATAPAGSTHTLAVGASAHPLQSPAPMAAGSPTLFRLRLPAGIGDFATAGALAYGQFLPVLWSEWRRVDFSAPVTYSVPSSTVPLTDQAMLGRVEPMSPSVPTPILPTLGPVQSPLVNGTLSAFASLTGVTTTPTLSWSAPALGVPTSYTVEILALGLWGGTTTIATSVARWRTASTQIVVPPGLLQVGTTYYARIKANANAPDPFDTQPIRSANIHTYASTLTGTFSP